MTTADLFPSDPDRGEHRENGKPKTDRRGHPTPKAALARTISELGDPTAHWDYHNSDGSEAFRVYRFEFNDPKTGTPDKEYRPVHQTATGWVVGDPPGPLPLYRLTDLDNASTIYVTEGEKASDAVRRLGLIATTSAHGAQSPHKSDWSPLAGKDVVILPDHDGPGEGYLQKVIAELNKLNPRPSVKVVRLAQLWKSDNPIPEGGDMVDWVSEGVPQAWEPEQCMARLQDIARATDEVDLGAESTAQEVSGESVEADCSADADELPLDVPQWPNPVAPDAFHGLPGDIVRVVEPQTEAHPMALLIQLLVGFGNLIGRSAHICVGAVRHHSNEFAVLVGRTAGGRKSTSLAEVMRFLEPCDPKWRLNRTLGGLSSGEGLIHQVRNASMKREPIRKEGKITGYQEVEADPGEADKRLWINESEFAGPLKVMSREGNTLSSVLRDAWDKDHLGTLTRNYPLKATGAHISIVGHITGAELNHYLTATDALNGFANRFIWVAVERTKLLPLGGNVPQSEVESLVAHLKEAMEFGKKAGEIKLSKQAEAIWVAEYPRLTRSRPGILGAVTSRAEAHVLRLALIYAVLDKTTKIKHAHLRAALAVWDYSFRSAVYIFGERVGDKHADAILDALRASKDGLTRDEIRNQVFNRNLPSHLIGHKLGLLLAHGLAKSIKVSTGGRGRPTERWVVSYPDAENAHKTPADEEGLGVYGVNGVGLTSEEPEPETDVLEEPEPENCDGWDWDDPVDTAPVDAEEF